MLCWGISPLPEGAATWIEEELGFGGVDNKPKETLTLEDWKAQHPFESGIMGDEAKADFNAYKKTVSDLFKNGEEKTDLAATDEDKKTTPTARSASSVVRT